jgi:phytoene synthase
MRVLPKDQRDAMFAIYAFCRAVDDIADGPDTRAKRLSALAACRADVDALLNGAPAPWLSHLLRPVRAYGLARDDFVAIVDGVEMDARADIVAPDLDWFDRYCDRVACAVGRLAVRVFGLCGEDGRELAHHLGRALQMTNILRDLDEDAAIGRVYVPRELLRQAGVAGTDVASIVVDPALGAACQALALQARDHFARADRIMHAHPLRRVRAPLLMSKTYETLLERLLARGFAPPRRRVRIGRGTMVWTVLRFGLLRFPDRTGA